VVINELQLGVGRVEMTEATVGSTVRSSGESALADRGNGYIS
jgi:hypothetical protein